MNSAELFQGGGRRCRPAASRLRAGTALACLASATILAGCLGEPPIEDRWTRLDLLEGPSASAIVPGQATPVSLKARITYREILTGAVIAEVRVSDTLVPEDVDLQSDDRLARARDVDRVLRNSTSLGFATRLTTGFDHLIQDFDLMIESAGIVPPSDSIMADSTAGAPGPTTGTFLLVYFGDVEEVEIDDGEEIEVVTPFFSDQYDILPSGVALQNGAP